MKFLDDSQISYYYYLAPFLAHGILMKIIFVRSLHLAVILLTCNCHVSRLSLFKKSFLLKYCRCVFAYVILT